jgi:HKD family nuclease
MFNNKIKTIAILTFAIITSFAVFAAPISFAMTDATLTENELWNIWFNDNYNAEFNAAFNKAFNDNFNADFDAAFNENFNTQYNMDNPKVKPEYLPMN